jgi:hypothetical protein
MLCSNRVLQKLNDIELWQNTDVNGGSRMPYVASVPFDNTWSFSGSNVSKLPLTVIEVEPI